MGRVARRFTGRVTATSTARRLAHAIGDAAFAQVIRRELDGNFVAAKNSDVVLAHLSGNMRGHDVTVFEFDSKLGVGKGFENRTFHFYVVFFSQELLQIVVC